MTLIFFKINMTVKKHGLWKTTVIRSFTKSKPDYRVRMSDNAKDIITLPVYKEEFIPDQDTDHLFLMKNIFN